MKHWEWALFTAFLLSLWLGCFSSFAQQCQVVRQDTLRLHILANSDSEEDQKLKLMVRDEILAQTSSLFSGAQSRDQAIEAAEQALPQMLDAAKKILHQQGYDYPVSGDVIPLYFTTRQYDEAILPAGVYDAVQIRIGNAQGQNWWCVLFPPLCIGAAQPEEQTQSQTLSDGAQDALTEIEQLSVEYVPKFAALEWLSQVKERCFPS